MQYVYEHEFQDLNTPSYPVGSKIYQDQKTANAMSTAIKTVFKDKKVVLISRGSSGAILAAMIAAQNGDVVKILHIRKESERSHYSNEDDAFVETENTVYIIVDDFIHTGKTISSIWRKLEFLEFPKIDGLIVGGVIHPDMWGLSTIRIDHLIAQEIRYYEENQRLKHQIKELVHEEE